ncbi:MAG: hypothetical protein HDS57_06070 [Barnesiella sp.]|nr:hypothetical protein [Barnesiella sp.]
MSMFSTLKRALGFGNEDFDQEIETSSASDSSESEAQPTSNNMETAISPSPSPATDDPLPADILDGVVNLFNSIQPEFVKKCIDTEAQKRYLLESIDSALRSRIEAAIERGHDLGKQQWEEERQSVADEITELRNQKKVLEQKRDESKNARLSAERQKRALNDRVHDLENQVLTLEAEKEQLQLENRSMLNKFRVAGITGMLSDDDSRAERMLEEVESLRLEKSRLEADLAEAHSTVDTLAAKIDTLTSRLAASEIDSAEIARLRSRNDDLTASADKSASLAEALRTDLEAARQEIESLRATIESNLKANAALLEAVSASESSPVFDVPLHIGIPPIKPEKTAEKPAKKKKRAPSRKKEKPRISAIDELMDSTDWLVAPQPEPPKETPKEDDFGYQEPAPKKNPAADDDRQLSLW